MSVALAHGPADVARWALVAKGAGSDPDDTDPDTGKPVGAWPIYASGEPPSPDNCLTLTDTAARSDGASMTDGEEYLHWGVQIRVRAGDYPTGFAKAEALRVLLNEGVYDYTVAIGSARYLIHCFSNTNLLRMGKEAGASKRDVFTVNAMLVVTRTA